mmetsp:Transcript_83336/g.231251  ORF Transcript_83336/g.231251 Transcript_83336/m.231251 type:complete len:323 (+) Transcript_83336:487-1455(+)
MYIEGLQCLSPSDSQAGSRPAASISSSATRLSAISSASWVSVPVQCKGRHCFLPDTQFKRPDGSYVTAAGLRRSGDTLLGPQGTVAQVIDVQKYKPVERDVVSIRTAESAFRVTADHWLLAKGPKGLPVPLQAQSLLQEGGGMPEVFDGSKYHVVTDVSCGKLTTQVVDVCLESERSAILAWTFPPQRKPRRVRPAAAVACLGRQVADRLALMLGTPCYLAPQTRTASGRRSRSCGDPGDPASPWSVGTRAHSDHDPGRCEVCAVHHRYVRDQHEPKTAPPCRHGASCKYCHAPHHERTRVRPTKSTSSESAPAASSHQRSP